jgi:hypothetical protein
MNFLAKERNTAARQKRDSDTPVSKKNKVYDKEDKEEDKGNKGTFT